MTVEELSIHEARWLAVIASGLDRRPFRRSAKPADLLTIIQQLGMVQLDTISVISRSHETVLWSRLGSYNLHHWTTLFERGQLTEYWAHAAAIVPMADLPVFRTVMEWFRDVRWLADESQRAVMDQVVAHMRERGPMGSRDFEAPEGSARADAWEWWGNKPERHALSMLWTHGETVLSMRDRGFGRTWSLADEVVPELWTDEAVPVNVRNRVFIARALKALGVTTAKWASDYYRTGGPVYVSMKETRVILDEMAAAGTAIPIRIKGIDEPVWLDPDLAATLPELRAGRKRPTLVTLLSPFDNLIWNRDRCEKLWAYDYRLECYTPAPKRKYGYYNMPILYRGHLVGRLDPSFDRKKRILTIKSFHMEPGVRLTSAMASGIREAIEDLNTFLGGIPGSWVLPLEAPSEILPLN